MDRPLYFAAVVSIFLLLSSSFPRLFSAVGNWMSTILPHNDVGLSANSTCRSEMCCTRLAENTGRKKSPNSPSGYHRTTLSACIFATKACIDNRNKNSPGDKIANVNFYAVRRKLPEFAEITQE